jgi:coenzyme F420-0:L-glutamate ligase/coenzyme F420-1:gamma-L-glutamate ligase
MKISPVLEKRRSIRSFQKRRVPRWMIRSIVAAGCTAPSAHDLRPWRVVALDDRSRKSELATVSAKAYFESLISRGIENARDKSEKAKSRILSAPVILVVCLDRSVLRAEKSTRRKRNEWIMGTQSVAAMVENMLLQASELGLGACWRGSALFISKWLKRLLFLPNSFEPQAIVEIGYPSTIPREKKLERLEEKLRFNVWGEAS